MQVTWPCRLALLALLAVASPVRPIMAQDKPAQALAEYEVASVKPIDPNVPKIVGVRVYPGGRVVISALSLKSLIATAFRLSYWQISGGDAWVEKDIYTVEAKPAEDLRS